MRPLALSEGHGPPGVIDELVPGVAAMADDVVVRREDTVGQPVLAHELPDVLDGVQLRRAGRERQKRDVGRNVELGGAVPAWSTFTETSLMPKS